MPIQKRFGSCAGLGQMPMATLGVVVGQGGRSRGSGKDRAGQAGQGHHVAPGPCTANRSRLDFHRISTGYAQVKDS